MELLITAPESVQEWTWNYEELKAAALAKAKEYKEIAYTDADEAVMKKDKADLNRIINQVEDERKRLKKACMKPYDTFEAQVKDVLLPLRDAVASIERGLAEIDAQYRKAKTDLMRELYSKAYSDVSDIVPFDKTVKEEYYKKAFTEKKLEKAYTEMAEKVRADLKTLDGIDERYRTAAIAKYLVTFLVSDAQGEVYRLMELDKAQEERRRKEEEERSGWRAELERKQRAEEERARELEAVRTGATAPELASEPEAAQEPPKEETKEEPIISFGPLICYGTKAQLMGLAEYIRSHGIECRKPE